ncbi:uracil nucleotide/cysteinyl leukotriene receptor [Chanos chanos]|uniref:Uracil nucleotide/cysteinyl leukotriene receptor n=1 Tax=Chanos chanos TaxID=29144 RepID=A0A6J2URF9_CHACN|nr:uracil nucleotide/cysteinyl leukotriene receptor-like [Chanos chanos]
MNHSDHSPVVMKNNFYSAGSHEENVLFATYYIIILIISVPFNALALWVFCRQAKSKSPSKVFLLNLAIADMAYVLVLPMRVVYHAADSHWPLGEAPCRLVGVLFFLNLYCSLLFMMFISLDRLVALVLPIKSQSLRKTRNAKATCILLWIIVTFSMLPKLMSTQTMTIQSEKLNITICSQLYFENTTPKALVSTAVAFTVPLLTLTVSYILILIKLRTMKFQERTLVQQKAIRLIILTMVNILVAFVPYHVHRFIYIERHAHDDMTEDEMKALAFGNRLTSALMCVSGVFDPVMYFFLASTYQQSLTQIFCKRSEDNQQQTTSSKQFY